MSGPWAEDGRLTPLTDADRERIAQHERRLAIARPPAGTIRILSVVQDDATWHVDLDVEPVADETHSPTDPDSVRLHIETDEGSSRSDLPVEVLQRIAQRIREL